MLTFNRMVERLDLTYSALAHPIRREVLERLRSGPQRVTALAEPFEVSLAAVSKHLQMLERAGLVSRRPQGREHLLALQPAPLADASGWLDRYRRFWEGRLDYLEGHLREGL